ncbi:hypothetical protein [Geitlerinema sp. PCC 9228]|jgi:hypothetical protein|uniref:hypothetical protein n=1 Tax=Geitlerinema sp. PCC 9228 TaxID=111611 RepID=UPI0008F9D374|nr:hypothetical protein [Geitlerinema sp. PCC 9228]
MNTWNQVAVLVNALAISLAIVAPATAATPANHFLLSTALANQPLESSTTVSEYEPPDHGGPEETGDAGTH